MKMYLAYALTVAYSPNFSSPIAFTCMVRQNFPLPNISHVQYSICSLPNMVVKYGTIARAKPL